jgi:NADH-quinone oxidoreductase subunit D
MNPVETLQKAQELLTPWGKGFTNPEPNRLDVIINAKDLFAAVERLKMEHWGYLSAITGLDLGVQADALEALYHFCSGSTVATLRVPLPRRGGEVPSIHTLIPVADFFERELMEMFGVTVTNVQDNMHLFLPDDWPDGVYPLLKDFDPQQAKVVNSTREPPTGGLQGDRFIVPIGPQHPALKEPGHFEFTVEGEIVVYASMRLGYAHRGLEKAVEQRNWVQNLYLLERVCGICSHTHAYAYSLGVEQLAGVEAPPRAQAIRELVAGLERLHSHLLWLGVGAHEAGFDTLFMYSWRDRETVMDLLEQLSGNRVNYSANVLGGVKFDVSYAQADAIRSGMDYMEERIRHYLKVVTTDSMFLQRTRGIGTMTLEQAEYLGALGPTARASGVLRDVRVEAPYGSYRHYPISLVMDTAGDLEARFKVRMKELLISCNAIRAIVDNLPESELVARVPRRIPAGETVSRVEAPRGEAFYFIKSNGSDIPERIKVRTPSLCNWTSVLNQAIGRQLADIPLLIAGMDPCFSCNDRMVVVTPADSGKRSNVWSWEQLRQYGIDFYHERRNQR